MLAWGWGKIAVGHDDVALELCKPLLCTREKAKWACHAKKRSRHLGPVQEKTSWAGLPLLGSLDISLGLSWFLAWVQIGLSWAMHAGLMAVWLRP